MTVSTVIMQHRDHNFGVLAIRPVPFGCILHGWTLFAYGLDVRECEASWHVLISPQTVVVCLTSGFRFWLCCSVPCTCRTAKARVAGGEEESDEMDGGNIFCFRAVGFGGVCVSQVFADTYRCTTSCFDCLPRRIYLYTYQVYIYFART